MIGRLVPKPILMHWYTCGRKVRIVSEPVARIFADGSYIYRCPHGTHWHIGRRQTSTRVGANHSRKQNAARLWDQIAYRGPVVFDRFGLSRIRREMHAMGMQP